MCEKPANPGFANNIIGAFVVAVLIFWLLGGDGLGSFITVVIVWFLVSALADGLGST